MSVGGGIGDLRQRRDSLAEQLVELQWDLGGLAYEMAIRDHFRLDVLSRQAAKLTHWRWVKPHLSLAFVVAPARSITASPPFEGWRKSPSAKRKWRLRSRNAADRGSCWWPR